MYENPFTDLSNRYSKLTIPGVAANNVTQDDIHPHEFMVSHFPTFIEFYNYFSDLDLAKQNPQEFSKTLHEIYHDLRDIPVMVSVMTTGQKPEKVEKIFSSMKKLTALCQQKLNLSNVQLAKEYRSKGN